MTPRAERVLGVVGTFVLDRIVGLPGRPAAVEDLGGLAYALSAASASLPPGWRVRPIARVGADADDAVGSWLEARGFESGGLDVVDEPNNRVELRYRDAEHRTERLVGGVGGWHAEALVERVLGCDALLVNFVSGVELSIDGAEELRARFPGPIYADLHSLLLGMDADGTRVPRPLENADRWLGCFDAIQVNEAEFDLVRGDTPVDVFVRRTLGRGPALITCTRGRGGALCWSTPRATTRFRVEAGPRSATGSAADDVEVLRSQIDTRAVVGGDPTGCGDVWGMVMWCRLLAGDGVEKAAEWANRLAAVAAETSGTRGLPERLAAASEDRVDEPEGEGS